MAHIDLFIPHVLHFECGLENRYMSLSLEEQFEIAKNKCGYSDDPVDPDRFTVMGIRWQTYIEYCRRKKYPYPTDEQLINIKFTEWREIMKSLFWDRWKADSIKSQKVAENLVDWVWGSGKWGIVIPQRILGTKEDGIVGNKTLGLVNDANETVLLKALYEKHLEYIDSIVSKSVNKYLVKHPNASSKELKKYTYKKFENGWKRRVKELNN